MTHVRWKPARDGFVESHDGRWHIYPMYWGCTRPQVYELRRDGEVVSSYCSTQRDAKQIAEEKELAGVAGAYEKKVLY